MSTWTQCVLLKVNSGLKISMRLKSTRYIFVHIKIMFMKYICTEWNFICWIFFFIVERVSSVSVKSWQNWYTWSLKHIWRNWIRILMHSNNAPCWPAWEMQNGNAHLVINNYTILLFKVQTTHIPFPFQSGRGVWNCPCI